nr:copper resistance protein NlpE [uncultured Flavobacterium sp.]
MKNKVMLVVLCGSLFFLNCKKEVKEAEIKVDTIAKVAVETPTVSDNSQNSLDWQGTYRGVTPCADCEGIETEIILNLDLTYVMKTKYLGKGDGKVFEEKGSFVWDKSGANIALKGGKVGPSQYKVRENQLIQLDMEGNPITGDLADMFVLKK